MTAIHQEDIIASMAVDANGESMHNTSLPGGSMKIGRIMTIKN
jgi:hypothetical protein